MMTMTTMIPMYPTHYPTTENFRSARALLRCHLAESVAPVVTVAAVVAAAPLVSTLWTTKPFGPDCSSSVPSNSWELLSSELSLG